MKNQHRRKGTTTAVKISGELGSQEKLIETFVIFRSMTWKRSWKTKSYIIFWMVQDWLLSTERSWSRHLALKRSTDANWLPSKPMWWPPFPWRSSRERRGLLTVTSTSCARTRARSTSPAACGLYSTRRLIRRPSLKVIAFAIGFRTPTHSDVAPKSVSSFPQKLKLKMNYKFI